MDQRDQVTWVVLEVSSLGENLIKEGEYESELRRALGVDVSWPVFVPTKVFEKEGKRVVVHLMEGYCFVGTGLDEVRYFRLEGGRLVNKVMSQKGPNKIRALHVLGNFQVEDLRKKMDEEVSSDLEVGMTVIPSVGPFSTLEGKITLICEDQAQVFFDFRSRKVWKMFPKVLLTTV